MKLVKINLFFVLLLLLINTSVSKTFQLLNVSYDPTRELYEEYNKAFTKYYKKKTGDLVTVRQSHGGSSKQATSVINGIKADVVTLALAYDINSIAKSKRITKNWIKILPNNSAPYTSTIVFLVRKGNPKNIRDWPDLTKNKISVITPNPKSSGGARWNYLAAWGYSLETNKNNKEKAKEFVKKIFKNVIVQDFGSRSATNTFFERGIGDVLISWENEAYFALNKLGNNNFELVTPSISILAEPSITLVDKIVDRKKSRNIAYDYLNYLYSLIGQEIIAKNYYRPRNSIIAKKYSNKFHELKLFTIDNKFHGWNNAQKEHFSEGGSYDKIMQEISL